MSTMNFKKLFAYSIGLWLITLVVAGYYYAMGQVEKISDQRYAITLNEAERLTVLKQMGTLTQGVSDTLSALADNDTPRLIEVTRTLGGARGRHEIPKALSFKLPLEYKQLMTLTQTGFDALANMAERGAPKDAILKQFARLTNLCVTCHGGYTIRLVR